MELALVECLDNLVVAVSSYGHLLLVFHHVDKRLVVLRECKLLELELRSDIALLGSGPRSRG